MMTTSDRSRLLSTEPGQYTEGPVAKAIESQTSKLPSDTWLWAAGASMLGSLALQLAGNRQASVFVGKWVPTFLILGLYNKLVKQLGADRFDPTA
jgi:hypothetical protein